LRNCLTIDLESISHRYLTERRYLSEAGRRVVDVEKNRRALDSDFLLSSTRKMLQAIRRHGHAVTFFVVGEVYEWYPALVQEIKEMGHEVAHHSHTHFPIDTRVSLRKELQKSGKFLLTFRPKGFRAPRASVSRECAAELANHGFVYDSSSYGPFRDSRLVSGVIEVPISTYGPRSGSHLTLPRPLSFALLRNCEIPFGSGYFIALLSSISPSLVSYFIKKSNKKGFPAILSLHPWQLYEGHISSLLKWGPSRLGILPYDFSCHRAFEHLLRSHNFCTVFELLETMNIL